MAKFKTPSKQSESSRKFLEQLLADYCRAEFAEDGKDMIKLIEQALAKLPAPSHNRAANEPPDRPDFAKRT